MCLCTSHHRWKTLLSKRDAFLEIIQLISGGSTFSICEWQEWWSESGFQETRWAQTSEAYYWPWCLGSLGRNSARRGATACWRKRVDGEAGTAKRCLPVRPDLLPERQHHTRRDCGSHTQHAIGLCHPFIGGFHQVFGYGIAQIYCQGTVGLVI